MCSQAIFQGAWPVVAASLRRCDGFSLDSASIAVIVKRICSEPTTPGCSAGRGYWISGRRISTGCHPTLVRRQSPHRSRLVKAGASDPLASSGSAKTITMSRQNLRTARPLNEVHKPSRIHIPWPPQKTVSKTSSPRSNLGGWQGHKMQASGRDGGKAGR